MDLSRATVGGSWPSMRVDSSIRIFTPRAPAFSSSTSTVSRALPGALVA